MLIRKAQGVDDHLLHLTKRVIMSVFKLQHGGEYIFI